MDKGFCIDSPKVPQSEDSTKTKTGPNPNPDPNRYRRPSDYRMQTPDKAVKCDDVMVAVVAIAVSVSQHV